MGIYRQNLVKQVDSLRVEQTALASQLTEAQIAARAKQLLADEPLWEEIFKELSHALPREIYLTSLALDGRQVHLRGRVRQMELPADLVLTEFMKTLKEGFFMQVRLGPTRQLEQPPQTMEFEIQCLLR